MAQFVDTTLLLGEQSFAQDERRRGGQSAIERTFAAQMGHVRGANHDLGGHAADVDAGAADYAALDQGDARTAFHRFERGRHGGATTADDRHVEPVTLFPGVSATAQPAPCLVEQAGTGWFSGVFERRSIPQGLDGGLHLFTAYDLVDLQFGLPAGVGNIRPMHARNLLQGLFHMRDTGGASHANDFQFGHNVTH
ncbi:hypothetical protein D9M68_720480 [compost metagenome]